MTASTLAAVASILRLSGRIGEVADLKEMLQETTDTVAALLPADRVAIIEFDLNARTIGGFVGGGAGSTEVLTTIAFEELWDGLSGWVLREHQSALSRSDVPDERESDAVRRRRLETDAGSIIVVPLIFQDRVLGTMTAINRIGQREFTERDVETMEMFADICAVTIENTRLLLTVRAHERELLNESDLRDRLFAVLAHDLRGPIGNLQALLQMIAERLDEPELVKHLLDLGSKSAGQTYNLTENLLSWIRSQLKGNVLPWQDAVCAELIRTVQEWMIAQTNEKNVTVTVDVAPDISVYTEPRAVETILRNLVSNAVKFSNAGSEVTVSSRREGSEVIFEVKDRGLGMTPEQIGLLFTGRPIKPLRGTAGEKGNGLGLMFSSDLAKTVRGRLEADSAPGKGSTFRLVVADTDPEPEEL
jgi:signal transduction histidine kinase